MKVNMKVKSLSRIQLFVTPQTAAHQAPPSMGFSRQKYWNGVPLPSPCLEPNVANNDIDSGNEDRYLLSTYCHSCTIQNVLHASTHLLLEQPCETERVISHFIGMETEVKKG